MSKIIRAPRGDEPFSIIRNSTIRDTRLTYRARGILHRLLSNKDGYQMSVEDLTHETPEGRDAVARAIGELKSHGYIVSEKKQNEKGRWHTVTYVYDEPQEVVFEKLKQESLKKTAKKGSANAPTGKNFGNFSCEYVSSVRLTYKIPSQS